MKQHKDRRYERYEIADSMWAQNPGQRDIASLIGMTKGQLGAIVRDKERYIRRDTIDINGKLRNLTVPTGKLRMVHERLKFQLNKIKQPPYLCSPRKGVGQRDNAEMHVAGHQLLKLDIRQFYPKTMQEDIWRWAHYSLGIMDDVAGLFAKLAAIDGRMPFGSPISPVLTSLVHRGMFDKVYAICGSHGLKMSLWVDDLTISGAEVPGGAVTDIRQAIRAGGFQTHKIEYLMTARPTEITGVPIAKGRVLAPHAIHRRIKEGYEALKVAASDTERSNIIDKLLSALGSYRYHLGSSTPEGRLAADRMQSLRQRRAKMTIVAETPQTLSSIQAVTFGAPDTLPWD
ncbi:reverse transcriptase domain-containing protein [Sphingomonas sp. Leaf208]|uniref:reverse transcriptase domain-containing protein n=1 Tax=Sphingomonas sp. Leaf208 TaxID=1735679 RepID=UPI0012E32114|nr:reverse transcriptase domain-containing protein [Sphingomonas sp. Leaf208]